MKINLTYFSSEMFQKNVLSFVDLIMKNSKLSKLLHTVIVTEM